MTFIRRGWLHLASGAGLGRLFGFVGNLLLSRWLGPSDLGLFNLITTTVQTSDTLVRCGGDYALNYELGGLSEATKTKRGLHLIPAFVQLCTLTTFIVCVGVGIWCILGHAWNPYPILTSHWNISIYLLLIMIFCEGCASSAWEVLLVSRRTALLALRHGLFLPLRIVLAAIGAYFHGVLGAMWAWSVVAVVQCLWLRSVLKPIWNPFYVYPPLTTGIVSLLKRGIPFYLVNLLSSVIFYPLLLKVASSSGLVEVGYLRAGQILQQIFAFLPATLVPVLFLKLRSQSSFADQVNVTEKPLRLIWLLMLELLLLYSMLEKPMILGLFGSDYLFALLPTRLLLLTALFESLAQLAVQPILASGNTRLYGTWQNVAAVFAAFLGWFWIPTAGLIAYLIVRLIYVLIPLIALGTPVIQNLNEPKKVLPLALSSLIFTFLTLTQALSNNMFEWAPLVFIFLSIFTLSLYRDDLVILIQAWDKR